MKKLAAITAALLSLAGAWTQCMAQDDSAPSSTSSLPSWSADDLDQMLGPIALYPDPLIGLILPASTVPSQIVVADRYVSTGGDTSQIEQQPWDPAVQGLAHYPQVLKWMDDNIAWTTELGEAFSSQQPEVMDAIQRLRAKAQSLGNLQTTPQQTVDADDGTIGIEPANPDEIYVPEYQPDIIYAQPGVYCTFGIGFPIGVWLGFDWDWRHHGLIHWGPGHERPPDWWHRPANWRRKEIAANTSNRWRPRTQSGSVIVTGGDRGYAAGPVTRGHAAPRTLAPRVAPRAGETPREVDVRRAPAVSRAPEESRPVERSQPSESAFGGSHSSGEVRAASSRGAESRSSVGGGGGGGGGGGRSGGGRR